MDDPGTTATDTEARQAAVDEATEMLEQAIAEGRLVRIGDDVVLPAEFRAASWGFVGRPVMPGPLAPSIRMNEGAPQGVLVSLDMKVIDGVPQCTQLVLSADSPDRGIPAKAVREFRLEDWIEKASEIHALRRDEAAGEWVRDHSGRTVRPGVRRARARSRGHTDEFWREVAQVYQAHIDDSPTKAVHEHFDVAKSTAQAYVKKARERGFITASAPTGGRP